MASKAQQQKNKPNKDKKSQSLIFRGLGFLFSGTVIRLGFTLAVLLLVYVIYLDATIRSSFEGRKWQVPARVYARPMELFVGIELSLNDVVAELQSLGYSAGSVNRPGSYFVDDNAVVVQTRGHTFWDGEEKPRLIRIEFSGAVVQGLADMAGQEQMLARLEPIEIGAIYPNHQEDRILLQLRDIPPLLAAALVAVEDHRFYEHAGISLTAIARAAMANIRSGSVVQGGSTLTQQLVKNYYLTRERSLSRKFTEAIMSLLLDWHYDKEAILEAYFNEVYLGQSGARAIHGFGLGAQFYFNRPLQDLSIEKLALMIAIIRGPAYYDPWRHPERALDRRNRVLDVLATAGIVAPEDVDWAKSQPLNLGSQSRTDFAFPAYMDVVKAQLRAHYPNEVLTSEGLRIYTALDPRVHRAADQAASRHLELLGMPDLQSSVVVTEPSTGELLAILGGRNASYAGFNRAVSMKRSIGSVIKPFVYLTALQQAEHYTLMTLLDDSPIAIEQDDGSIWSPRNFDRESHGMVPLVYSLAFSYNQATARLGHELGLAAVVNTLDKTDVGATFNRVPSLLIGTSQLSPFQVTQLYQTLASGGYTTPIRAIRSVLNSEGIAVQRFPYKIEQAYSRDNVFLIDYALKTVATEGSARRAANLLGPEFSFAAKTGTSGQGSDAWLAGYTSDMLATVWVGFDDNRETNLTGSSAALPIWVDLARNISRGQDQSNTPQNVVFEWVDRDSGSRSHRRCEGAIQVPFIMGTEPSGRRRCAR